jgi:fluoride exporter
MSKTALTLLGVALAGSLGALARFGIAQSAHFVAGSYHPVTTLLINVSGAFCLGWLSTALGNSDAATLWKIILGVGFLGAFTTFSTMMLEADKMLSTSAYLSAAAYLAGSLFLGLIAVRAGVLFGRI